MGIVALKSLQEFLKLYANLLYINYLDKNNEGNFLWEEWKVLDCFYTYIISVPKFFPDLQLSIHPLLRPLSPSSTFTGERSPIH